ncbi:related to atpase family protein [Ceraceosorus bombacis]|uniref:Related to atpase family protein n=1 Tax=Ceraceosorus bombacis TaxID=401625 RepID=A0A0N7LAY5_9BASI|nr:related to atpase family protein [Ceraceosorus bombacis]
MRHAHSCLAVGSSLSCGLPATPQPRRADQLIKVLPAFAESSSSAALRQSLCRARIERRRLFHSSSLCRDYYKTLEVPRNASTRDIKAQFYRLSKKWHPDVNKNDEGAKKKFQEVSEAWTTLGNERSRRDYDRRSSEGAASSSGGSSSGPGYSYDSSSNTQRRARATYAWEYQRRSSSPKASRSSAHTNYSPHGASAGATSSEYARAAFGAGTETSGASQEAQRAAFDSMVRSQRAREEFAAKRGRPQAYSSSAGHGMAPETETQRSNPLIKFAQVVTLFLATAWLGSKLAAGTGSSTIKADEGDRIVEEDTS